MKSAHPDHAPRQFGFANQLWEAEYFLSTSSWLTASSGNIDEKNAPRPPGQCGVTLWIHQSCMDSLPRGNWSNGDLGSELFEATSDRRGVGCPKTSPLRCSQLADSPGVRIADIGAHKQMILTPWSLLLREPCFIIIRLTVRHTGSTRSHQETSRRPQLTGMTTRAVV